MLTWIIRKTTPSLSRNQNEAFALIVMSSQLSHKRRRQAGTYVGNSGRATSSCVQASVLGLSAGQLFSTFANGTMAQFSATTGAAYAPFVPSTTPGDITTQFSLSNDGTLLWTNDAFFNGGALFCVLPSGQILAIFQQNANPTGCVFIDLTIAQLTTCFNANAAGSGSVVLIGYQGPSGPQGLPGPQASEISIIVYETGQSTFPEIGLPH